jgi:hypothetical protein
MTPAAVPGSSNGNAMLLKSSVARLLHSRPPPVYPGVGSQLFQSWTRSKPRFSCLHCLQRRVHPVFRSLLPEIHGQHPATFIQFDLATSIQTGCAHWAGGTWRGWVRTLDGVVLAHQLKCRPENHNSRSSMPIESAKPIPGPGYSGCMRAVPLDLKRATKRLRSGFN